MFLLFELMFNVPVNSYSHVETLPHFYGTCTPRCMIKDEATAGADDGDSSKREWKAGREGFYVNRI